MIIKVKSVFAVKLPGGVWLNLAALRSVQVLPDTTPRIRLVWDSGTSEFLRNEQALAVLEALEETDFIDKSVRSRLKS